MRSTVPATNELDRVRISLSRFVGGGYVVYALLVIPQMVTEAAGVVPAWYPPVGAVLAFGPGIALLIVSMIPKWHQAMPVLIDACTAGLIAAAALWLAFADGSSDHESVWILDFAGLVGITLVLWRPVGVAIVALATGKLLGSAVAITHVADADVWSAIEEALFGMVFSTVFILLVNQVLRMSSELDESRAATEKMMARDVANVELARVDALIHDHVLSTFVSVSADRYDPRLVDQARGALDALDSVVDHDDETVEIDAGEVVARLRAVLAGVDGDLSVTVETSDDAALSPVGVVAALAEAAAEATRNSIAHAGPDAQRAVFIGVSSDLVQVVVTDDGHGFDPGDVPSDRLGVALSIRHRVGTLPGGDAAVISTPGGGCTVRLRWVPSQAREQS
ncbi:histidine kinase [Gordonia phthalatica]|uniref:Histidine kinase n=2 Tax=Gordonia phthalatica TaxID=1136941 RepID=A0A0N9N8B6_9ACTN|nr:histidine kinase [Gordonia phthalatica]